MDTGRLQVGDRVILQQSFFSLQAGASGTIVHIYTANRDYCRVQFDHNATNYPIPCHFLRRSERAPRDPPFASALPMPDYFYSGEQKH